MVGTAVLIKPSPQSNVDFDDELVLIFSLYARRKLKNVIEVFGYMIFFKEESSMGSTTRNEVE